MKNCANLKLPISYLTATLESTVSQVIFSLGLVNHSYFTKFFEPCTASLCTSQQRRRYVSNETSKDTSIENCQKVSVVRLNDVLLERCDEVSRKCNNDVPSERLHSVSNETAIGMPMARHQDVSVVRIRDVQLVRLYAVPCNSQMKLPIISLWYIFTTSPSYVIVTP